MTKSRLQLAKIAIRDPIWRGEMLFAVFQSSCPPDPPVLPDVSLLLPVLCYAISFLSTTPLFTLGRLMSVHFELSSRSQGPFNYCHRDYMGWKLRAPSPPRPPKV